MSDATLKPCPFCGGGAVVSADMASYPQVACDACGATHGQASSAGISAAIAIWNTRADAAEIAKLKARNAALVEALRVADVEIMENVSDSEFIRWAENVVYDIRAAIEAAGGE